MTSRVTYHRLLERQVKKSKLPIENFSGSAFDKFLAAISAAYEQADLDREMLERSLALSSDELLQINSEMRAILETFADTIISVAPDGTIKDIKFGKNPNKILVDLVDGVENISELPSQFKHEVDNFSPDDKEAKQFELDLAPNTPSIEAFIRVKVFRQHPELFILIVEDVTDAKMLEQQLLQSQKLESLGVLASGVAHEINTPIHYVGSNLQFLQMEMPKIIMHLESYLSSYGSDADKKYFDFVLEQLPEAIDESLDGVARVKQIVASMKEFTYIGSQKSSVDINHSVNSAVSVTRNEWKLYSVIDMQLNEELPRFQGYPGDINQVLLNLIVNATHAIQNKFPGGDAEPKGVIRISTTLEKQRIVLRVRDNGTGIPPDIRSRIFDPFFTTKDVGEGTGQGLAITHSIVVEKHGGEIYVDSAPGEWTEFTLVFPV